MRRTVATATFVLTWFLIGLKAEPIKLHPSNPHYFLFNGQPTVLITSAEHYGAAAVLERQRRSA